MRYAAIALWFVVGCGDDSMSAAGGAGGSGGSGGTADASMPDAMQPDGSTTGCDLVFDDHVIGPGAEVSAAMAPDGTMVIAYCSQGLTVVRGDARTMTFDAPQTVGPGFCDPTLAYAGTTFYLADDCRDQSGNYGICEHVSSDGGRTWSQARFVDTSTGLVDRPWIFPGTGGKAVMTWNRYPDLSNNIGYTFATSVDTDGTLGQMAMLTTGTPACTSMPGTVDRNGDVFAVGNLATDLAPASEEGPMYLWSQLGGNAWTQNMMPSPDGPVYAYPSITSTPDSTLWVFYTDEMSAVYLTYSTSQGATWSNRVRVNPQTQTPRVILVWAQAGADGQVRMTWYEQEAGSNPPTWHVYFARTDAMTPVRVDPDAAFRGTNGEFDDNFRNSSEPWLGDFTSVVTDGMHDYVVYTANSQIHVAASRCR